MKTPQDILAILRSKNSLAVKKPLSIATAPWSWQDDLIITASENSDSIYSQEHWIKKHVIQEASVDLLALSAAWYRIRMDSLTPHSFESLTDSALFKLVTAADHNHADAIRKYYAHKLMVMALTEVPLTNFRKALQEFVNSPGTFFTSETLPLVYRLPEFYEYDREFAQLKDQFTIPESPLKPKHTVRKLFPKKYFTRKLKSGFKHEYWFEGEDGIAYKVNIDHGNQCKSLWDREFALSSMTLDCTLYPSTQDGLPYYRVTKWSLA